MVLGGESAGLETALRARGLEVLRVGAPVVQTMDETVKLAKDVDPVRRPLSQLVERRDGDRTEMLTAAQAARYDLMVEATRALLEVRVERPDTNWVPEMAPLNKRERRGVLAEAFRRAKELEA